MLPARLQSVSPSTALQPQRGGLMATEGLPPPISHQLQKHSISIRGRKPAYKVSYGSVTEQTPPQRMQCPIGLCQPIPEMCCSFRRRQSTAAWSGTACTTPAQKNCKVSTCTFRPYFDVILQYMNNNQTAFSAFFKSKLTSHLNAASTPLIPKMRRTTVLIQQEEV